MMSRYHEQCGHAHDYQHRGHLAIFPEQPGRNWKASDRDDGTKRYIAKYQKHKRENSDHTQNALRRDDDKGTKRRRHSLASAKF